LRYEALKEVAYTLGVQTGVRWRYDAIDNLLEANRSTLDRVFDFRPLLLHDGRVAPAVVDRSEGAYRLVSPTEARQTEATYTIEQEARLVSRPPDWRDYLPKSYPTFTRPDPAMLPRDAPERQIWASAVASGWREGVVQANRLFDSHLARLRRDYLGMARCKLLALEGIVDIPLLAENRLGVTVNGRMLSVGERLFRIPTATGFEPVGNWKPIIQYIPASSASVIATEPSSQSGRDTSEGNARGPRR
jgi:defect-in-organelle-trafficking protein DotC